MTVVMAMIVLVLMVVIVVKSNGITAMVVVAVKVVRGFVRGCVPGKLVGCEDGFARLLSASQPKKQNKVINFARVLNLNALLFQTLMKPLYSHEEAQIMKCFKM